MYCHALRSFVIVVDFTFPNLFCKGVQIFHSSPIGLQHNMRESRKQYIALSNMGCLWENSSNEINENKLSLNIFLLC